MPKVSVIIPIYNSQKNLKECLNSVINQTLKDIEIICIDDGSTDKSLKITKDFAKNDNRIIILTQQNKGAGSARNLGIEKASGDYLAFLDSDDFYDISFLEKMHTKITKTNSDIICCGINTYNNKKKKIKKITNCPNPDYLPNKDIFSYKDIPLYIFNTFKSWCWNKLFKRSFIVDKKIKFQELQRTNDLLFTYSAIIQAEKITVLTQNLVFYRINQKNNLQATNHLHPYDFYKAYRALRQLLIKLELYEETKQSFINMVINGFLYNIESIKNKKIKIKLKNFFLTKINKYKEIDNIKQLEIYNKDSKTAIKNLLIKEAK